MEALNRKAKNSKMKMPFGIDADALVRGDERPVERTVGGMAARGVICGM